MVYCSYSEWSFVKLSTYCGKLEYFIRKNLGRGNPQCFMENMKARSSDTPTATVKAYRSHLAIQGCPVKTTK